MIYLVSMTNVLMLSTSRLARIKLATYSNPGGLGGFFNRSYLYDNIGNVSVIGDNAVCQQQNFSYDAQNRLTNANTQNNCGNTTPGYSIAMSYDQVGNITAKTGVGTYNYNNGHAHQISDIGGAVFGYDGNGNQSYGPNGHSLNWNYDNQPTYSYNVNGVSESYAYDANGERVIRNSSSGINTYFVGECGKKTATARSGCYTSSGER